MNEVIDKDIMYCDHTGFILEKQGWCNIQKSIDIIHHIKHNEGENNRLTDSENLFDNIRLKDKKPSFQQNRYGREFPESVKGHLWKTYS